MPVRPPQAAGFDLRFYLELSGRLLEHDPAAALEIAQTLLRGDPRGEAAGVAHLLSGQAHYRMGQLSAAREALEAALAVLPQGNALWAEGGQALGRVYRDLGAHHEALAVLSQTLARVRSLEDLKAEAETLNLLAGIHAAMGQDAQALKHLEKALGLAQGLQLPLLESNILTNLGRMYRELQDRPRALESLLGAFRLQQSFGADPRSQGSNLLQIGQVYEEMGEGAQAEAFYRRSLELGQGAGDCHIETAALNNLANAQRARGDLEAAAASFRKALENARRFALRAFEADNLDGLGQTYAARGELEQAVRAFEEGLRAARAAGDPEGELELLLHEAEALLVQQGLPQAQAALGRARLLAEQLGRKRYQGQAEELLSQLKEAEGDHRAALAHLREAVRLEREALSEEGERRARQLAVQFDLERARTEAEMYRMRTEAEQEARERAEAEVRQRTADLEAAQLEVVNRLALASEYRDDNTGVHIERVGQMAGRIARALGWLEADAQLITTAARLHDVGKIGVPDSILLKPGALTASELAFMREHTLIGGEILAGGQSRLLRMAHEIALAHHERWDGGGYPRGLKGEAIPLSARIVAVADVLDALIHARPYKEAWPLETALGEIHSQSGSQFDPEVVQACLRVFSATPEETAPGSPG